MLKPYKNNTEYLMKGPSQCNHTIEFFVNSVDKERGFSESYTGLPVRMYLMMPMDAFL